MFGERLYEEVGLVSLPLIGRHFPKVVTKYFPRGIKHGHIVGSVFTNTFLLEV